MRLLALLAASESGYLALLRVERVEEFLGVMALLFACYALACRATADGRVLVAGALLFRLTMVPAGIGSDTPIDRALGDDLAGREVTFERFLLYDHDLWRYLWDGHVLAHTGDPYAHAPESPELDALAGDSRWEQIRDYINHPWHRTVYPPAAQLSFLAAHAIAPGSVVAMKLVVIAFDLGAGLFVALALRDLGQPPALAALYAWNPLVVKVFAGSGHFDSIVACALAACVWLVVRGRRYLAAGAFAAAVLAKLSPIVLLPFLARRIGTRATMAALAIVLCGLVPFPGLFSALRSFASTWEFNAGPFALVSAIAGPSIARVICAALALAAIAFFALRDDGHRSTFAPAAASALGTALILGPVVMPWYVTWVLPLAAIGRQLVWLVFSVLVCTAFLVLIDSREHPAALCFEYGTLALVAWRLGRQSNKGETS